VATFPWGVVVFEEIASAPIGETLPPDLYPHAKDDPARYVWARWRMPSLQEIYRTRPFRDEQDPALRASRGWWWADREELQERARKLREMERALRSRHLSRGTPVDAEQT
jgi:hypothetical protein